MVKEIIKFNFNLKKINNQTKTTRINYSFVLKKYLKSLNSFKLNNFFKKLTKNKKKFKRNSLKRFNRLLKDRYLSNKILKLYSILKPFKRKKKKRFNKKKIINITNFKSNYYKDYINKKNTIRRLFFFYVRKKKVKHSQKTNFLKFKNLFLKNGLFGKRELFFFKLLTSLKLILKQNNLNLIYVLKYVFKQLTFFCELKKKRKFNNEILIPYPVSKRRGFFLGIKLLISNTKLRVENKLFYEKMALEIYDTFLKKSLTYKDLLKYNKTIKKNLDNIKLQKLSVFHYID